MFGICGCNNGGAKENNSEQLLKEGKDIKAEETPTDSSNSGGLAAPRRSILGGIAVAGGITLAPHLLCLAGLGGFGVGTYAVHNWWCAHSSQDLGIPLEKLPVIPEERIEFSGSGALLAEERLLAAEPRFREILALKQKEAEGEPIKVVFLEDQTDKSVSVVFCKNGGLCPCSEPELYDVGHKSNLANKEEYPGQHAVLEALYFEK